jgi:hypothetical protein
MVIYGNIVISPKIATGRVLLLQELNHDRGIDIRHTVRKSKKQQLITLHLEDITMPSITEIRDYQQRLLQRLLLSTEISDFSSLSPSPSSTVKNFVISFPTVLPDDDQPITPNIFDVKCGQDKRFRNHYGNLLQRNIIIDRVPKYLYAMSKKEVSNIIRDIVNELKYNHGSRFLSLDKKTKKWKKIPDSTARDKVSHAMRTYVKTITSANLSPSNSPIADDISNNLLVKSIDSLELPVYVQAPHQKEMTLNMF